MSLKSERELFRAGCAVRLSREIQDAVARADVAAAASALLKSALRAGDKVPDFRLANARWMGANG